MALPSPALARGSIAVAAMIARRLADAPADLLTPHTADAEACTRTRRPRQRAMRAAAAARRRPGSPRRAPEPPGKTGRMIRPTATGSKRQTETLGSSTSSHRGDLRTSTKDADFGNFPGTLAGLSTAARQQPSSGSSNTARRRRRSLAATPHARRSSPGRRLSRSFGWLHAESDRTARGGRFGSARGRTMRRAGDAGARFRPPMNAAWRSQHGRLRSRSTEVA
jgi:hypothetical protein